MRRMVGELVLSYQDRSAKELNIGRAILDMARGASQFGLRMPSELPLLGKTLLNLHEIGRCARLGL
jgi:predicted unusual protein kinase regulating ubiquinone biosynthesis (AarF/ABC1/UbiB family)